MKRTPNAPDVEHSDMSVKWWKHPLSLSYDDIKVGVSASFLKTALEERQISRADVQMIISSRTLERRIAQDDPLKPEEIDGLARLARVQNHALRVFEDPEVAEEWLRSPNPVLDDEIPMQMAATDLGAREVEAVLTRFEYGVFD